MAESPIQSSFIPHDTVAPQSGVAKFRSSTGLYDLLMLIAIVLFVASAVLAVGVFLYEQFLQTQSASKLEQLQRAKAAFEPALIAKLTRLDDRMHAADQLLAAHLAPSLFFGILQQVTLQTIAFDSLGLEAANPLDMGIHMSGAAQSVNSIALEADLFSKSTILKEPIFSSIQRQPDGVHFSVTAKLNPALLKYSQIIEGQTAAVNSSAMQGQSSTTPPQSPFERGPGQ